MNTDQFPKHGLKVQASESLIQDIFTDCPKHFPGFNLKHFLFKKMSIVKKSEQFLYNGGNWCVSMPALG